MAVPEKCSASVRRITAVASQSGTQLPRPEPRDGKAPYQH
jgi:hypothetical protein